MQHHHRILLGLLPLSALIVLITFSPQAYTSFIQQAGNGIVKYSEEKTVEHNGRLTMMLYREAERQTALQATAKYRNREAFDNSKRVLVENIRPHNTQRNVHLIVLESFLDPRLFDKLRFNQDPAHPDFEKLFGTHKGLSIAPVFGGATAQAEFEILCGVPALEKVSSVEFNVFTGTPVYCLPGILTKLGYQTIATNAYKPNFFNAIPGYQGAGFEEIYFPVEFSGERDTYFKFGDPGDEDYMFDRELLEQNLTFLKDKLKSSKKPIFNYIMTIYGHTPHLLDNNKRPEIIKLKSDFSDDHLQRATNQFYYRTQALADYVRKLIAMDKNSLIIIISDHVPPLRNGPNTYRALEYAGNMDKSYYHNPLMIIQDGQPISYETIHHYDLPQIVLDYVSANQYCQQTSCRHLQPNQPINHDYLFEQYMSLMAHAAE